MEKSKYFEMAKNYYDKGLWSKKWLANAVKKGKITQAEYQEITGEELVTNKQ